MYLSTIFYISTSAVRMLMWLLTRSWILIACRAAYKWFGYTHHKLSRQQHRRTTPQPIRNTVSGNQLIPKDLFPDIQTSIFIKKCLKLHSFLVCNRIAITTVLRSRIKYWNEIGGHGSESRLFLSVLFCCTPLRHGSVQYIFPHRLVQILQPWPQ